jgi:hypothetical protein
MSPHPYQRESEAKTLHRIWLGQKGFGFLVSIYFKLKEISIWRSASKLHCFEQMGHIPTG